MPFIDELVKRVNAARNAFAAGMTPGPKPQPEPLATFEQRQQYKTGAGYHIVSDGSSEAYLSVDMQGHSRKPK